jgi:sialidase-1
VRYDETLVEPTCQASLSSFTYNGREVLLFSNPARRGERSHLTVRASFDGGKTWPAKKVLSRTPSAYSCLAMLPDSSIACLHEMGTRHPYERIRFVRFRPSWANISAPTPS